jgi:hypothetical protein
LANPGLSPQFMTGSRMSARLERTFPIGNQGAGVSLKQIIASTDMNAGIRYLVRRRGASKGKPLGPNGLNQVLRFLCRRGVLYRRSGRFFLTAPTVDAMEHKRESQGLDQLLNLVHRGPVVYVDSGWIANLSRAQLDGLNPAVRESMENHWSDLLAEIRAAFADVSSKEYLAKFTARLEPHWKDMSPSSRRFRRLLDATVLLQVRHERWWRYVTSTKGPPSSTTDVFESVIPKRLVERYRQALVDWREHESELEDLVRVWKPQLPLKLTDDTQGTPRRETRRGRENRSQAALERAVVSKALEKDPRLKEFEAWRAREEVARRWVSVTFGSTTFDLPRLADLPVVILKC